MNDRVRRPAPRSDKSFALLLVLSIALLCSTAGISAQGTPVGSPAASSVAGVTSWWNGAPCYELFVRAFFDADGDGTGDFNGVTEKLDYLNDGKTGGSDLGVTCVWLMPILEATSYHGYDIVDYYAVESDYGTRDDFARMVVAAHARGIRVILDHVINHTGIANPWFQDAISSPSSSYRDWYIFSPTDPGYAGPWGDVAWHPTPGASDFYYGVFWSGMPDLNLANPAVTAEIYKISDYWLTEMGVDGFRVDAAKHLIEDGQNQQNTSQTLQWLVDFQAHIRTVKPDVFTVGEVSGANAATLAPYYPDGLSEYFQFDLANGMLKAAEDGSPLLLGISVRGTVEKLPDQRYATFLTNHDQPRVATMLDGNACAMRVAAILMLSLPGTPFIYYGEEIGLPGDKPDEMIRTPMPWTADANGGFSTGTPWESLQPGWEKVNVAAQASDAGSLFNTYRTWINLRTMHPALAVGSFTVLKTDNPDVFAFERSVAGERLVVVVNLGEGPTPGDALTLTEGTSGRLVEIEGDREFAVERGAVSIDPIEAGAGDVYQVLVGE